MQRFIIIRCHTIVSRYRNCRWNYDSINPKKYNNSNKKVI